MIDAKQIPVEAAMEAFMKYEAGGTWHQILAAALNAWPHVALSTHVEEGRRIILPLQETKP
jgi:hypothetical protein